MTEPKKPDKAEKVAIPLWWSDTPAVQQVYGDEALLQIVGDHVYLAFGQAQVPAVATGIDPKTGVEIRPVARLVLTHSAFRKVASLLGRTAEQLPDAASVAEDIRTEEER